MSDEILLPLKTCIRHRFLSMAFSCGDFFLHHCGNPADGDRKNMDQVIK